jgi:hypothetical protein
LFLCDSPSQVNVIKKHSSHWTHVGYLWSRRSNSSTPKRNA